MEVAVVKQHQLHNRVNNRPTHHISNDSKCRTKTNINYCYCTYMCTAELLSLF